MSQQLNRNNKKIAYGYTREIRKLLPNDNVYYDIPDAITEIIWTYFFLRFVFNSKYHGDGLEFTDDHTIVKRKKGIRFHNLCIIGDENGISSDECNVFSVEIKWIQKVFAFDFGYLFGKNAMSTINNHRYGWRSLLGHLSSSIPIPMETISQSFFVGWNHRNFYYWGEGTKSKYQSDDLIDEGDCFKLEFDFVNDKITLYHNGIKAQSESLKNRKSIIPAISIRYHSDDLRTNKGDSIQIINYTIQ